MKIIQIVSLVLAFLMCVSLLFIPLFNREAEVTSAEQLKTATDKTITLASSIESSNAGVVGEFVAFYDRGELLEFEFIVKDKLYGNVPEEKIIVTYQITSVESLLPMNEDSYNKGEEYILILHRFDSLFHEYARYYIVNGIHIPCNDIGKAVMNGSALSFTSDVQNTIISIAKTNGFAPENNPEYFTSENLKTVAKECDAIIEVKVLNIAAKGITHNGITYLCELTEILKGEKVPVNDLNRLYVVAPKNSLTIGSNYCIMITTGNENSLVTTLASSDAIIPVSDINAYEKLLFWINK